MSFLTEDDEFFRYLVSKIVQTTPSDWTPEVYANNVFQRAVLVYDKVRNRELSHSTRDFKVPLQEKFP